MSKQDWCYAFTEDGPYFETADSREDAIDMAVQQEILCGEGNEGCYVGTCRPVSLVEVTPDYLGEKLIEQMVEQAGELVGECVEVWEEKLAPHSAKLDAVLTDAAIKWLEKEGLAPNVFHVEKVEYILFTPEQLAEIKAAH